MGITGSPTRYSSGAILLHWLIAFALAAEIAIGFTMPKDASGFALFQLHKSIGITILLLTLLRLGWRFTHKRPAKVEGGLPGFLASAVHVLFYAFMILAPLTGWVIVSSDEIQVPTLLFGTVPWPHLPVSQSLNEISEEAHELLAFIGIALFVLHVAGALRHHILKGDELLSRMAPTGKSAYALLLGTGVIALGAVLFFTIGQASPADGSEDRSVTEGPATEAEATLPNAGGVEEVAAEEEAPEEEEAVDEEPAEVEEDETEASAPVAGPPPDWTIQPGGSLRFTVDNAGSALNGSFREWGGRIAFDPQNPETADIAITIQPASATLGNSTQDEMLRGGDFLAASAFPVATWRSTSVSSLGGGRYRANGTLSLKGASRPQTLTFTLSGSGTRRSVTGQAVIDRNAFSVGTGDSAEDLGSSVTINFAFDATR